MNDIKIFCFGFGQVAKNFIKRIKLENFTIKLSTTTTQKTSKNRFSGIDYTSYFLKDELYDENLLKKLKEADYILISIPPINGTDQVSLCTRNI